MDSSDVRSDAIDVSRLLAQVRERLREKRGVDYTEEDIRALASVELRRFLEPKSVRSDLLAQYQRQTTRLPMVPGSLFEAQKPLVARIRRLLNPILRLFFNPDPLSVMITSVNEISTTMSARSDLYFELLHNLVLEFTRTSMEVKNLQLRVDSLTARLELTERRARALEAVVEYREDASVPESATAPAGTPPEGPGTRSRRRRARRVRRAHTPAVNVMGDAHTPKPPES
jgi:hypothetical protein